MDLVLKSTEHVVRELEFRSSECAAGPKERSSTFDGGSWKSTHVNASVAHFRSDAKLAGRFTCRTDEHTLVSTELRVVEESEPKR
jgi:hypothetical protein